MIMHGTTPGDPLIFHCNTSKDFDISGSSGYIYPTGIGFPVFPVTYPDIFYFFLRSLISDKLPKEEKQNLFRIYDRKIPKTNSCWV